MYKNVLIWDRKWYVKDYRVKRKKLHIILKNKMKEMENMDKNNNNNEENIQKDKAPAEKKENRKKYMSRDKKKKKLYDVERIVLYALCLVLLGLVISLATKNYRLQNKVKALTDAAGNQNTTETVSDSQKTESDSSDQTETTEVKLSVLPGVSYTEIQPADAETTEEQGATTEQQADADQVTDAEQPDAENGDSGSGSETDAQQSENYNGEDLADNGCTYAIKVNRQENIVTIYKLDAAGYYTVPVKAMRCSVSPVGETPVGTFNISMKWDWLALFDNCYGQYVSQIEGDTLFHSVPYVDTDKSTLETWEFNKLGTGASLGCVRLCVADTKWIYENCEQGTYVNIFDSDYYGPLGRPVPVTKLSDTENPGWDPTDMVEENPTTGKPVIYGAESHSIKINENYDVMAGIWAFNSNREDVTDQLKTEGTVDNTKAGRYTVKYSFEDNGQTVDKTIVITVEDDIAPVVTRIPIELKIEGYDGQKEELAELVASYVTAIDNGNPITKGIATDGRGNTLDGVAVKDVKEDKICVATNHIDNAAGSYNVVCCAMDSSGNASDFFTVKVTIVK